MTYDKQHNDTDNEYESTTRVIILSNNVIDGKEIDGCGCVLVIIAIVVSIATLISLIF